MKLRPSSVNAHFIVAQRHGLRHHSSIHESRKCPPLRNSKTRLHPAQPPICHSRRCHWRTRPSHPRTRRQAQRARSPHFSRARSRTSSYHRRRRWSCTAPCQKCSSRNSQNSHRHFWPAQFRIGIQLDRWSSGETHLPHRRSRPLSTSHRPRTHQPPFARHSPAPKITLRNETRRNHQHLSHSRVGQLRRYEISPANPCWRRASYSTSATQLERLSERASVFNMGMRR